MPDITLCIEHINIMLEDFKQNSTLKFDDNDRKSKLATPHLTRKLEEFKCLPSRFMNNPSSSSLIYDIWYIREGGIFEQFKGILDLQKILPKTQRSFNPAIWGGRFEYFFKNVVFF